MEGELRAGPVRLERFTPNYSRNLFGPLTYGLPRS